MRNMKGVLGLLVLIVILGSGIDAYGFLGFGGTSWQEEVLLHDGGKIIIDRWVDRGGRHEVGQKPPIKEQHLSFTLPSSREKITWKVVASKEVGNAEISPIMLGIVNETPYLVMKIVGCLAYNKWKRPNPPYIVFRYTNKVWQQIEIQELPSELKVPNLIISSPDVEAQQSGMNPVSAAKIRALNSSLRQPEYKTILREAVEPGKYEGSTVNCEELVHYKGAWVGPGDSTGKRMMDRLSK